MNNGLYPPILDTYMPGFTDAAGCNINFTISPYSSETFKSVHLIITSQFSNQTVLDTDTYPLEIIQFSIGNPDSNGVYSIRLTAKDLKDKKFQPDVYYKVQLRLSSVESIEDFNASFITENVNNFSEWSKPCLIRYIGQPKLYMEEFDDENSASKPKSFFSILNHFRGKLDCSPSKTEYLYSYRLKIFTNDEKNQSIADSGLQYTDEFGDKSIDYSFNLRLEEYLPYKLIVEYNTNSGYQGSKEYYFYFNNTGLDAIEGNIFLKPDRARGSIRVTISSLKGVASNIMIRRTSNKSLYTIWEDVHLFSKMSDGEWFYEWEDLTIEAGVVYLYGVQLYEKTQNPEKEIRGEILTANEKTTLALFEHTFLYDGQRQLRLKYDLNISSLKYIVLDSKAETLGSQYPFIRRNAKVNYRTFPISGIISYKMDDYSEDYPLEIVSPTDLIVSQDATPLFFDMRDYNGITQEGNLEITQIKNVLGLVSNNYDMDLEVFLEKKFREEVIKFLQDGKIKLFKSETEGNMLIRLMDVSFTPKKELGQRIYSFSATAYEIDTPTIENYKKYDLTNIGEYNWDLSRTYNLLSQISDQVSHDPSVPLYGAPYNLINLVAKSVYTETLLTTTEMQDLKWMRIIFNSPPYYISNDDIKYFMNGSVQESHIPFQYPLDASSYLKGYLIRIETDNNGKKEASFQIINSNGVFEFSNNDYSNITSITIAAPMLIKRIDGVGDELNWNNNVSFDIDFLVTMKQKPNDKEKIDSINKTTLIGQLRDTFGTGHEENFISYLKYKHNVQYISENKRHFIQLDAINGLEIEAPPGTIVKIQDSRDALISDSAVEHTHIIGATGIYHLYHKDGVIMSGYFDGIRLIEAQPKKESKEYRESERYQVKDYEFVKLDKSEIFNEEFPIYHGVYNINNEEYIYYDDKLWPFISSEGSTIGVVKCPIEASINYYGEIEKGTYRA